MRALISAYACEPNTGSEPGIGYSVVRAAAEIAECWVLTRSNNIAELERALGRSPTGHPVHLVPLDASPLVLRTKRKLRSVRAYYVAWQRLARRAAYRLHAEVDFDVAHHATMSPFWLPVGIMDVLSPLVVGPTSGGTLTPRSLIGYLGPRGLAFDGARWAVSRLGGMAAGRSWRKRVSVVLAHNAETERYARRWLVGPDTTILVHPGASDPRTPGCDDAAERQREVLVVGRLLRWKGVFLALEAFARAELDDARLVFIGDGEARRALIRRTRAFGLDGRVEITGVIPRDVVLRRMCTASALLFPSFHDSAGFAVSEALSLGMPVVCLDHGGPGALVSLWPDSPHLAVGTGTASAVVDEMAQALRHFVHDPAPLHREPLGPTVDLPDIVSEAYGAALAAYAT